MAVTVRAVTPAVGAEISGVDLRNLSDSDFAAIERAWTDHSMILLRGQKLGDDDLQAGARPVVVGSVSDHRAVALTVWSFPRRVASSSSSLRPRLSRAASARRGRAFV